jgi:hypothetical protein
VKSNKLKLEGPDSFVMFPVEENGGNKILTEVSETTKPFISAFVRIATQNLALMEIRKGNFAASPVILNLGLIKNAKGDNL